jgi:hypothetical protein
MMDDLSEFLFIHGSCSAVEIQDWVDCAFLVHFDSNRFRTVPAVNVHIPALLSKTHQCIGDTSLLTVEGYMKVGL